MAQYIIPFELLEQLNEINNRTKKFATPTSIDDVTIVADIDITSVDHTDFVLLHNLQEYVSPYFEFEI